MNEAFECSYTKSDDFRKKRFAKPSERTFEVALSYSEVAEIHQLDLSGNKPMEEIKDMFVLMCRTGLRFGDLVKLNSHNFTVNEAGVPRIRVLTGKTKVPVVISAVCPMVTEILGRYSDRPTKMPAPKSNQYFNRELKGIAKQAGLVETGHSLRAPSIPLFELISAHTGRRSFATWAYFSKEMEPAEIMKITGHSSIVTFLRYVIRSGEEAAGSMDRANRKSLSINALRVAN